MMKIKADCACNALDMSAMDELGVDYVGVRLGKGARVGGVVRPHCVGNMPDIVVGGAQVRVGKGENGGTRLVGIFADDMMQNVLTAVYNFNLDVVQLDGDEGATFVRNLLLTVVPDIRGRLSVIKGLTIATEADFGKCCEYEGVVDMFIFRIPADVSGGFSVPQFQKFLDAYKGGTPFLLKAEGTDAKVVSELSQAVGVCCGVDAGTSLTTADGGFDDDALRSFVNGYFFSKC